MTMTTQYNREFVEEQYSSFILRNLQDGLMPDAFYRDVSDFGEGETLHIKSIGEASIQEVEENTPLVYNPIETGEVLLQITDYPGDAWYVTDKVKQDYSQVESLLAARAQESTRALQEYFETRAFETLNAAQTNSDPNNINDQPHRLVGSGSNDTIEIADFVQMKLSFDKAQVPYGGRVAIVDPIVEATLNTKFQTSYNVDSNPTMQNILEGGFARDHKFVIELFGWNIMTSNRLPVGDWGDGTSTVTGGVANIFISVLDDQTKSLMVAWRQAPTTESERNKDLGRDEFVMRARMGFGVQRVDSLGVIATSATAIS